MSERQDLHQEASEALLELASGGIDRPVSRNALFGALGQVFARLAQVADSDEDECECPTVAEIQQLIQTAIGEIQIPEVPDFPDLSIYYTASQVDSLLAGKSAVGHNHDSRYYTKAQVDALLEGYQRELVVDSDNEELVWDDDGNLVTV